MPECLPQEPNGWLPNPLYVHQAACRLVRSDYDLYVAAIRICSLPYDDS